MCAAPSTALRLSASPTALVLLALVMAALCLTTTNALAVPSPAAADKRGGPPVRNPYSWMASPDGGEPDKRSAFRRPQNPYSWMAANEEPGGQWVRLRRLGAPARAGISRNPYSWTNF